LPTAYACRGRWLVRHDKRLVIACVSFSSTDSHALQFGESGNRLGCRVTSVSRSQSARSSSSGPRGAPTIGERGRALNALYGFLLDFCARPIYLGFSAPLGSSPSPPTLQFPRKHAGGHWGCCPGAAASNLAWPLSPIEALNACSSANRIGKNPAVGATGQLISWSMSDERRRDGAVPVSWAAR
jgi:hypothetical protein